MTNLLNLIKGETTRLLGYRSLWVLPAAAIPMMAMSTFGAAAVEAEKLTAGATTPEEATVFLIGMAFVTTLFSAIGGVIQVTRDLKTRSIGLTALVETRRRRLLKAKAIVASVVATIYAILGLATCAISAHFAAGTNDFALAYPARRLVGLVAGMILINIFFAAWGVALGAIIGHQSGAIALVAIWTTMVDTALMAFFPTVGRILPGGAVAAVLDDPELPERFGATVGVAILALWLTGAAILAQNVMVRRAI